MGILSIHFWALPDERESINKNILQPILLWGVQFMRADVYFSSCLVSSSTAQRCNKSCNVVGKLVLFFQECNAQKGFVFSLYSSDIMYGQACMSNETRLACNVNVYDNILYIIFFLSDQEPHIFGS